MAKLIKPEQHVLSNGIPVILQNYEGAVAATYWWVKTGSADENPKEAGFAHFLEHMLFKDAAAKETGKASTGQMARAIESLGGDINAYTSFDQTVYHVTCASHHWERIINAFGTMGKPQKFLRDDFEREREVILEELRKNEDSPGRQMFQNLFSATFAKHPYGKPVIGYVKTLKAAKVSDLEAFYRRNYVSGNMGLVLVGPMDEARKKNILKLLEKYYGASVLPKRPAPIKKRPVEPMLRKGSNFVKLGFDVKTPTVSFAFRTPELRHPDTAALDLAASVLGMGELSRLYQKLFYQTSMATDASGSLYVPHDLGMLYFQAEMDSMDKIEKVSEELLKEVARIRVDGPTPEELERVLVNAESERLYATQTADGMASRLGFMRFIMGNLDYDREYLEDLKSVDAKRIQDVMTQYLDVRRMSASILLPKDHAKMSLSKIEDIARKVIGAGEPVKAKTAKNRKSPTPAKDGIEFITRPSGVQVVYQDRPQSHVMSIHAAALGGLRLELANPIESREKDWGASYLMSLTWNKSTETKTSREIAALVEGSAASLDGFSGRNTVGAQVTGLARDWTKLSTLFTEILVAPTFDAAELEHSKRVAEDSIRGIEDHSSQLCSKLFLETLYENHPYGHLTIGSMDSVKGMTPEKLKAFHRAWVRPERLVISAVGAIRRPELERWLDELDRELAKMPVMGTSKISNKVQDEPTLKAPRWVEKNLGREQQHILVGGLGSTINAEERYALRIMSTLLGGQSGRLFIELREKKSLAYTVAPVSFDGIERGYIGTYIACAPQKRDEALKGIREVLEKLANKGPTPNEMARAKEFYLGRRGMELQSDSALATSYGLEAVYGTRHLSDEELIKRVRAVTAKNIQEVCKKYLVEPHMVTAVVG